MSLAALTGLSAGLGPTALQNAPEAVRHGGAAARQAYETGLGFQSMLLGELTQELQGTISGQDADSNGLGGSSDGGDSGSSPLGAYSSLFSSALTSAVGTGDQTGIAMQIARSIDPRLDAGETR